jgi:hypothetical protein
VRDQDFEKLGFFYLGKAYDLRERKVGSDLLLYESKNLTTHAVCMGMTGSGKTGLCLSLLEEAAIDGIPVIAIDPKGDLGNLLLAFPELRGEDFSPWVDPDEASRQGLSREQFADEAARRWREGLLAWGQDGSRIKRLQNSSDFAIYTPGSSAGSPLSVLRAFVAPPPALIEQEEVFRERIASSVSGLLALLELESNPISGREHILLANIFDHAWRAGHDLDLASLIHDVQSPPFAKVGLIDLETFFPAKERFGLAMKLNNLVASPGFVAWMDGESLDVGSLLFTRDGKPRLSILSIAHLSDAERMFFVTILLNEVLAWIRTQPGTSSLRAILYMDEIFGYFPPVAKPPSKMPMLTLLKQARAFGLGVVLATQNPVDLDYKGLANAGTWFLGRLQTRRDKQRVLDGLEGASDTSGHSFDREKMEQILSGLANRVFLMNSVYEDQPVVFQPRWALSYLRGPLTREQIRLLMAPRKQAQDRPGDGRIPEGSAVAGGRRATPASSVLQPTAMPDSGLALSLLATGSRPVVPPDVPEFFIACQREVTTGSAMIYRPALLGIARLHYIEKKLDVDYWETLQLLRLVEADIPGDVWSGSDTDTAHTPKLEKAPEAGAAFVNLPPQVTQAKSYIEFNKALKNYLYRERKLTLWHCPELKTLSQPEETQRDFRLRQGQRLREGRDQAIEKLRTKYAPKRAKLQDEVEKAREHLSHEQAQASKAKWDVAIAIGNSVLGAILGRKTISQANVRKATNTAKAASRAMRQTGDTGTAQSALDRALEKFTVLELEFQNEVDKLNVPQHPEALVLETLQLTPKKTDIAIEQVVLAWAPWVTSGGGHLEKVY